MTATQLSKKFLLYFQEKYPEARIYRNNAGSAKRGKCYVKFGIPPKGGADFISFHPAGYRIKKADDLMVIDDKSYLQAKFWEIKCANDKISKEQKQFFDMITKMGGDVFVVKEFDGFFKMIKSENKIDNSKLIYNDIPEFGFYIEKWEIKE